MHFFRHRLFSCLLLAAAVAVSGRAQSAPAKALHYSLTEAICSREQGRLVLTVRVQTSDLEAALSARAQKKVTAADMGELAPLALDYVRENLVFKTAGGVSPKLEWAGYDATDSQLYLFFEAPLTGGLLGAHIADTLFLDSINDQINAVELHDGAIKETLVFSRENHELVVNPKL